MSRDFMADLEARVHQAAARIEELQRENLRLQAELAQLPLLAPPPPPPAPAEVPARAEKSDKAERAWAKERDEIRRRLETLIARLESLLS
jgi:cell division septum initiation protein DivIVA